MITPVDIENREFKKAFRGYDADDVEEFLDELVKDYSKLYRENATLKDQNAILTESVETYKGMEETMRSAIVSAQRTSEEILRNAHEQAENIVKEAKLQAKEKLDEAENRIQDKRRALAEVEARGSMLRAKLRAMITSHLQLLDEVPEELQETKRMNPVKTDIEEDE